LLLLVPAALRAAPPPVQVKVDFNSTSDFMESDGSTRTAEPSNLSDSQKAAIIAKAQKKFDDALGPGKVVVSEGTGGDIDIIVSGENNSRAYGNTGQPCKPGVVYSGTFVAATDSSGGTQYSPDAGLPNAVGETLAHEIAHKLGVAHNQETNPPTIMTQGNK